MGTIGRTNTGGAGLNLSIYPSTTQPANPVENMFWVNTDLAIPHWYFQNDEPSDPETGDLYVTTPNAATNILQLLRNNGIKLYFGTPRQYNGESWEKVGGKLYYNGSWHNLQTFVYDGTIGNAENNFNHSVGGYPWRTSGAVKSVAEKTNSFVINCGASNAAHGVVYTHDKIDFTAVSSVKITYIGSGDGSSRVTVFDSVSDGTISGQKAYASMSKTTAKKTVTLDTSNVTGLRYLGVDNSYSGAYQWSQSVTIYSIELVS